jgi:hypothetical protein
MGRCTLILRGAFLQVNPNHGSWLDSLSAFVPSLRSVILGKKGGDPRVTNKKPTIRVGVVLVVAK